MSKWYTSDKLHELVDEAHEGDRLEFDRSIGIGKYQHWAVYVGYRETSGSEGRKGALFILFEIMNVLFKILNLERIFISLTL